MRSRHDPSGLLISGVSATLTQDHLFETGWWFRVAGGTQETFFPVPTTQNYTGTTSTNDWTDVGALGLFSAQEVSVVKNTAGPSGFVTMTMKITNIIRNSSDVGRPMKTSRRQALKFGRNRSRCRRR